MFSPEYQRYVIKHFDPARPDPNLTLIKCLYLGKYDTYEKKNYQPKKLARDYKIIVLKFHIDTSITLAVRFDRVNDLTESESGFMGLTKYKSEF